MGEAALGHLAAPCSTVTSSRSFQVKSGTIFDNFLITDDEKFAEEFGNETWGATKVRTVPSCTLGCSPPALTRRFPLPVPVSYLWVNAGAAALISQTHCNLPYPCHWSWQAVQWLSSGGRRKEQQLFKRGSTGNH